MVTWLGPQSSSSEAVRRAQAELSLNWDLEPVLPSDPEATPLHIKVGRSAHKEAMRREKSNYFNTSDVNSGEYDRK